MNILKQRIDDFIKSLKTNDKQYLAELKKYALETDVPIIKDDARDFLEMILKIKNPKKILELGTAIGYSSLVMNSICEDAEITTVENYKKRIKIATENFEKFDINHKINLIDKNIDEYLDEAVTENNKFDLIFLDAAKAQYTNWLDRILKLLNEGGILIADNVFKDGEILESRFTIDKRDRTIYKRMREFLYKIMHDDCLDSKILNIADGITISIRTVEHNS